MFAPPLHRLFVRARGSSIQVGAEVSVGGIRGGPISRPLQLQSRNPPHDLHEYCEPQMKVAVTVVAASC